MSSDPAAMDGRGRVSAELVEHLCTVRGEPVMKTSELAEIVEISREHAGEQLEMLQESGQVNCRSVDGVTFWWST